MHSARVSLDSRRANDYTRAGAATVFMARECARSCFFESDDDDDDDVLFIHFYNNISPCLPACLPLLFSKVAGWLQHRRLHKPRDNNEMLSVDETKIPKERKKGKTIRMKFSETTTKTVSRFLSLGVKVSIK